MIKQILICILIIFGLTNMAVFAEEGGGASPRWKAPRNVIADLETTTSDGTVRVTLDTHNIWVYNATTNMWELCSGGSGLNWLIPIISTYDPTSGLPVAPSVGDRYLSLATATGWVIDHIYTWSGAAWIDYTPLINDAVYNTAASTTSVYDGTTWRIFGSSNTWVSLYDTPFTYVGQSYKLNKVAATETRLEYTIMTENGNGDITIGNGLAGHDYTLTFDGEHNDGILLFDEGLKQFQFDSEVLLPAGTIAAGTAPLKFSSGVSMTVPEAGSLEYTTDDLFFTIATGTARKRILFADPVGGLTGTRVSFSTTNGRLTDDAGFIFTEATDNLLLGEDGQSGSISLYSEIGVTDYSVKLQPSALMTENTEYTLPISKSTEDRQFLYGTTTGLLGWTIMKEDAIGDIDIGNNLAGTDYTLTFSGESNEGVITYMEDEDEFNFDCAITIGGVLSELIPQGDFTFGDSNYTTTINTKDAIANTFLIQQGTDSYFNIDTTNSAEKINLGNATTKPVITLVGSPMVEQVQTIADGVTTPSVDNGNIFITSANTNPTAITDFTNPKVGQKILLLCGSTTNATTIANGGNFKLTANWTPDTVGDNITLYVNADNDYIETSRTNLP